MQKANNHNAPQAPMYPEDCPGLSAYPVATRRAAIAACAGVGAIAGVAGYMMAQEAEHAENQQSLEAAQQYEHCLADVTRLEAGGTAANVTVAGMPVGQFLRYSETCGVDVTSVDTSKSILEVLPAPSELKERAAAAKQEAGTSSKTSPLVVAFIGAGSLFGVTLYFGNNYLRGRQYRNGYRHGAKTTSVGV